MTSTHTILSSLLFLTAPLSLHAQAPTESLPMQQSAYPLRDSITSLPAFEDSLHHLHLSHVRTEVNKLSLKAKRRKQPTHTFDTALSACSRGESALRGVDRVIIIDTLVIDKKHFLSAYTLSPSIGTLSFSPESDYTIYTTQIGQNVISPYRTDTLPDSRMALARYYTAGNKLVDQQPLQGLNLDGDLNYPYLMPDGQTLYLSARTDESLGNYDLFVTRYDTDNHTFYQAENMGMPYNSFANDYMLVIDEENDLGWFASDRYQPSDSVCIYIFIPNESRHTLDYETTDLSTLRAFATLSSTATLPYTPEERQMIAEARHRLLLLRQQTTSPKRPDFHFVLNDERDYNFLDDFKSTEAKELFQRYLTLSKQLADMRLQLQQSRETTPDAREHILNLERRVIELSQEVNTLAKSIRQAELQ